MPSAERTIVIAQPAGRVSAFVFNGENAPKWRTGVLEVKKVATEPRMVYRQVVKGPRGRRIDADYAVTQFDPISGNFAFETIAGPVRPTGSFEFVAVDKDTTQVTFRLSAELRGVKKWLMGGQVQKTMDAEMAALDRLKAVLES